MPPLVNTALLILANILVGILIAEFRDLKRETRETREKLDEHLQDFVAHGLRRPIN